LFDAPLPVLAEEEAEPEAEPEAEFATADVVIVTLFCTDNVEELPVVVAPVMLVAMCVNVPLAVAVAVPVVAISVVAVSELEVAAVDEGPEAATVSWLKVAASKPEGTITPAGSHNP
jgi:hypothetical protein